MANNNPTASPKVSSTIGLKNVVIAPLLTDTDEGQNGGEPKLTVTKLDSKGNKVYETEIASPGKTVVEVALERDGRLYLFCTEFKDLRKSTWDVYADSDVFTAMLDENGAVAFSGINLLIFFPPLSWPYLPVHLYDLRFFG